MMENLTGNGMVLPRLGLGTYRLQGDACTKAVASALDLGYRHIDTAEMYGNVRSFGRLEGDQILDPPEERVQLATSPALHPLSLILDAGDLRVWPQLIPAFWHHPALLPPYCLNASQDRSVRPHALVVHEC